MRGRINISQHALMRNLLVALILIVGGLPLMLRCGGFFPEGDNVSQLLPFIFETKRLLSSGMPLWSWNTFFGEDFISSYSYYTLTNPFVWINCLFSYDYIGLGCTILMCVKLLLCAYLSDKYFQKMGVAPPLSLLGSLLYTFSSWTFTAFMYGFFIEPMILFPLLLLAIERVIRCGSYRYTLLMLTVGLCAWINYYFLPSILIVAFLYAECRLFKSTDVKSAFLITLKSIASVLSGIMLASVILIPTYLNITTFSDSTSWTDFNIWIIRFQNILERFFSLIFPKFVESQTISPFLKAGNYNNAAYVSVFGVLLALLYVKRHFRSWLGILIIILTLFYVTPLNFLINLGSSHYYTRWAFTLSLFFILASLLYLGEYRKVSKKAVLIYTCCCGLIFILLISSTVVYNIRNSIAPLTVNMIWLSVLAVLNFAGLAYLSGKDFSDNHVVGISIAIVSVIAVTQLIALDASSQSEVDDEGLTASQRYVLFNRLPREHGDFVSRCDFMTSIEGKSSNIGLYKNMPSVESFHSVPGHSTRRVAALITDDDFEYRIISPRYHRDSFDALMSVSHIIDFIDGSVESDTVMQPLLSLCSTDGTYRVYQYRHYIPMGFTYTHYLKEDSLDCYLGSYQHVDIPKIMLSALVIDDADTEAFDAVMRPGRVDFDASLDSVVDARRQQCCSRFVGDTTGFEAEIDLDAESPLFFSVPYNDGFKAYIDGVPTKIYHTNFGFSSIIVPCGYHKIIFRFMPIGLALGAIISAIAFIILLISAFGERKNLNHYNSIT